MYKKSLSILFFLFVCFSSFAAEIQKVVDRGEKIEIQLNGSVAGNITEAYDEDSRVLFLEIPKASLNKKIGLADNPYIENFNMEDYGGSVGLTCRLKNKLSYKIEKGSKSVALVFQQGSGKKKLIVIDPGHGGKDPGAARGAYREKDIVLSVGKYLKEELGGEYDIIITRDTDKFITLSERPKMGNRAGAKLFVSLHVNAAVNTAANGVEVYFFSKKSSPYAERIAQYENSFGEKFGEKSSSIAQISGEIAYKHNQTESIPLAENISKKIARSLGMRNGGAHGANFAVLRGFNGPSILVEMGFISNASDVEKLIREEHQRQIAQDVAAGIREFFER
ncbi:N-acetylmuramoyl-L-alanine amidase family protein [Fusobacterium gonidiaformans]|uniref:N-acetylmuramoyl-L-alanine amidase family protein n=1 Tax=Fusobacterium gonidiaformans TaxID=849 RepID=UPI0023F36FE2|nr:N-acetylmuramoyl-L-alanine amidase [Fusobacterium gonidiaformans]